MPVTEPFDRHRDAYEAWFHRFGPAYESELAAVRTLLPQGLICEVGVGTGRFAAPLGITLGIDPSLVMLELARERGIQVARASAEALPFPPQSLDAILMVTTVCFLEDPHRAFLEARQALTPQGSLVLGFVDLASPLGQAYEKRRASSRFYGPARFWSTRELKQALQHAGFQVSEVVQTLFGPIDAMEQPDPVQPGHGRGAFVALRAALAPDGSTADTLGEVAADSAPP